MIGRICSFFCALVCCIVLHGAATAEYQFLLNVDEGVKDTSGNNNHPLTQPTESDFRKGDAYGVIIKSASKIIKLPSKVFPGAEGSVDVAFYQDVRKGRQMLFFTYHVRGDAVNLYINNGVLTGSYYNRKAKKWFNVFNNDITVPVNRFVRAGLTWKLPGEITLYMDGRVVAKQSVPEAYKANFRSDLTVNIGGSQVGKDVFNGIVSSLKISDECRAGEAGKRVQSKVISGIVGKYTLGFNGSDGGLMSLKYNNREYSACDSGESLWQLRLFNSVEKKSYRFSSVDAPSFSVKFSEKGARLLWKGIALPGGGVFDVTADVAGDGDKLLWTAQTSEFPENWGIDTFAYPRIPCAPTSKNKTDMFLTIPVLYGQNIQDPFTFRQPASGRCVGNAYTGGAHFQFTYLYGKDVPGFFIMARDPDGCYKDILWTAYPEKNTLLFTLLQMAEQRFISRQFKSLYPVETAVIDGDWYDAAKYYRRWAVKQKWCGAGTLAARRNKGDLPEWLYEADVAIRSSTLSFDWGKSSPEEALKCNSAGHKFIIDTLKCKGFSVWYNYNTFRGRDSACAQKKWMCSFNARAEMRSIPGLNKEVAELKRRNFPAIGYINSRIYDQSFDDKHPEKIKIAPYVMRDISGNYQCYNNLGWEGCRISKKWQEHLFDIILRDSLENGFSGMYLDSFGRGQFFCWADNHGHRRGDSRASVMGQRDMAEQIRRKMREYIPEYILSSEASIEQFVDKIDLKLHHSNIYPGAVPVWAAIYHDYQFVYGRNASQPAIQTTGAFHIGAITGRICSDHPEKTIKNTYLSPEIVKYYHRLFLMRRKYSDCIGYGEMLRPPVIKNCTSPKRVRIKKSAPFYIPVIAGSSWKGEDGRVAVFFTNSTDKPAAFSFELKGRDFAGCVFGDMMLAMEDGTLRKISPENGKYTLPPFSAAVIESKR